MPVHLDEHTDGYYCCGCGIRRSDKHHRVRKFHAGDPAWRNFCKSCHGKHLASSGNKAIGAYVNFCFGCGFARSSHFNTEHPIKRGQMPVKNFCAHCMKRVSNRAYIPTETLLGSSSDESEFELDEQKGGEEHLGRRNPDQTVYHPVSHQNEAAALSFDTPDCPKELESSSDELSPSQSVRERRHKCRSDRASNVTPLEEDQRGSKRQTANGHEDNVKTISVTISNHRAPFIEEGPGKPVHRRTDDDKTSGLCNSLLNHRSRPAKRLPDPPATPKASDTARDIGLQVRSSLISNLYSPSKRATFNERVEVRTSPTYWQREHHEDDYPYAQFHHEHYHEDLRDGQKAVPLKNPLRDPDGQTARQVYLLRYNVDEESFNSWSTSGADTDIFTASSFGCSFSSNCSGGNQLHPSNLHTAKGYSPNDGSDFYNGQSDLDETRPTLNNRQHQPYNANDFPCGQGKENEPYLTNPVTLEEEYPLFNSFTDLRGSEKGHWPDWSSRHDARRSEQHNGLCTSRADSPWGPEGSYSNHAPRSAHADRYSSLFSNFSKEYQPYTDTGLKEEFAPADQGEFPDDRSSRQGNSGSAFAYQQNRQRHHSRSSNQHRACNAGDASRIREDFTTFQSGFSCSFPGQAAGDRLNAGRGSLYDADIPFESSSTTNDMLHGPRLPQVGFATEIPDDISDSEVHNLFIPGYDDYVPWRNETSSA